jgi:hypothetical protein
VIIYANLDQEARWARITLPQHVLRRISGAALLLAAFAPADADSIVLHTPGPVDPGRARFASVQTKIGVPSRWDVAWADPRADRANDRRTALALAAKLRCSLPGARAISSLAELDAHLAKGGADAGHETRWVCKAPWTAAGRDRAHGHGPVAAGETRVHLGRMLERFGALVFEPWMDRILDLGLCGQLKPDGTLHIDKPHTLLSDQRGAFQGIDLLEPALTPEEHGQLARTAEEAGKTLRGLDYTGAFTIDAFVYKQHGMRKLHSLCELNARHSFGHVARALHGKLGIRVLGMGTPPPAEEGVRILVAPAADDPFTAWAR